MAFILNIVALVFLKKRKNREKNPGKEEHKNLLPGFAN